jgi:hypothetical protein
LKEVHLVRRSLGRTSRDIEGLIRADLKPGKWKLKKIMGNCGAKSVGLRGTGHRSATRPLPAILAARKAT